MTLSSLLELLERGAFQQLRTEIAVPLESYSRGLKMRGGSCPIVVKDTGTPVVVRDVHVESLIKAYLSRELSSLELDYLANCLDLSEDADYATESVREVVFALSTPETNGQLTVDQLTELLDELGRGATA